MWGRVERNAVRVSGSGRRRKLGVRIGEGWSRENRNPNLNSNLNRHELNMSLKMNSEIITVHQLDT